MLPPRALPRQVLRVSAGRSIPRALSQPAFPRAPLLSPLSLVTSESLHPVEVPSELLDRFEYRHRPEALPAVAVARTVGGEAWSETLRRPLGAFRTRRFPPANSSCRGGPRPPRSRSRTPPGVASS